MGDSVPGRRSLYVLTESMELPINSRRGDNATVLHYKNNNQVINSGDLVLVDAGCEVSGYASDITRTWPVNGKFSQPQREIYELVLRAELAGIQACQPGMPWVSMHEAVCETIAEGLIELGVLNCTLEEALGRVEGKPGVFEGQIRNFFMHGTGHFLGLDVHDVGGVDKATLLIFLTRAGDGFDN